MDELISRQAALESICAGCVDADFSGSCPHPCVEYMMVRDLPTIKAEPVKHGRWVKQTIYCGTYWESIIVCSACHYKNEKQTNYCPNCGAKWMVNIMGNYDVDTLLLEAGYEDVKVLRNYSYDTALIGVSSKGEVIYDYEKMVDWLVENEGFTPEDAVEWIDYNTLLAIPYFGEKAPIIMYPLCRGDCG